jgi:dipeptide/tripeptide permease
LIIAISSGGLTQLLVALGGGQFHPRGQTSSGSRFFSLIYVMAGVGAIIGILVAALVWNGGAGLFYTVLLSAAVMAGAGWICFLSGSWLYVERCIHPSSTIQIFSLAWDCIKQRSFEKNIGNRYSEKLVRDLRLVARLIPIFLLLLPLYSGQLQSLTTLREMEKSMSAPRVHNEGGFFCYEFLLIAEPITMIIVSLLLNEVIFPLLKRWRKGLMITHLTRLVVASAFIGIGFIICLLLQRKVVASFEAGPSAERPSVMLTLIPIVLFATGQVLVTSSGLELSWSHAPNALRSVSVALFSSIYALGSWISLALFGAFKTYLNQDSGVFAKANPSSGVLVYYGVCAGLAGLSLVGLLCMRGFYERTRLMKIDRDIEERAIEIALARLCSV